MQWGVRMVHRCLGRRADRRPVVVEEDDELLGRGHAGLASVLTAAEKTPGRCSAAGTSALRTGPRRVAPRSEAVSSR